MRSREVYAVFDILCSDNECNEGFRSVIVIVFFACGNLHAERVGLEAFCDKHFFCLVNAFALRFTVIKEAFVAFRVIIRRFDLRRSHLRENVLLFREKLFFERIERGRGMIINISSIASFCPNPRMTVYSSTKAYVTSYTIGAAEELKEKGITVTAVERVTFSKAEHS